MIEELTKCTLCPHECKVNRNENQIGRCRASSNIKVALALLHYWEEPCISGKNGSGSIFFSNCNMNCIYCQNYKISQQGKGKEITIKQLSDMFLKHQKDGAHNINLVTPTAYVYQIIEAIKIAKNEGLNIPIIYNTNGYDSLDTLELLNGYIDVYLPDFKYYNNKLSKQYSNIENYAEIVKKSIKKMYNQVGKPVLDEDGLIKKGLIIRHLILPNELENTKNILNWIKENIDNEVFVSIMAQYFPTYKAKENKNINRKLTLKEYEEIEQFLFDLELNNGYIQELGEHEEEYVPKF